MSTTTADFSSKYSTHLNILHSAGEVIDVNALVTANKHLARDRRHRADRHLNFSLRSCQ